MLESSPLLSIIIPCLNEEHTIASCLANIPDVEDLELIVVDGGSADSTLSVVESIFQNKKNVNKKIINSNKGRAVQMNAGAQQAIGKILLFLHADTLLPERFVQQFQALSLSQNTLWGFFDISINHSSSVYSIISWFINKRSRISQVATGDQAIFISRELFQLIGGYKPIPLMEDIEFTKRLRKISKALRGTAYVITSARRWQKHGVLKTIILMWCLRFAYFVGVSEQVLYEKYYGKSS